MSTGTSEPLREIIGGIERLRSEFGPSVCDVIFAEIVASGSIRGFFKKLGVVDPGDGTDRVALLSSYLRRKGATELLFCLKNYNSDVGSARRDGSDETQVVDRVLLERLIREESDTDSQGLGHLSSATRNDRPPKWDPYLDDL